MRIREAEKEDGEKLLSVLKRLDSETKFMLFEPNERKTSIAKQEEIIQSFKESSSKIMLLAIEEQSNDIVGFSLGVGNELIRNKHALYCVVGVLQEFIGNGIGKALLLDLEKWAISIGVHRLELTVMEHNDRAKKLYQNIGFQSEGIKRDSLKVDGKYINEIYMSKLI